MAWRGHYRSRSPKGAPLRSRPRGHPDDRRHNEDRRYASNGFRDDRYYDHPGEARRDEHRRDEHRRDVPRQGEPRYEDRRDYRSHDGRGARHEDRPSLREPPHGGYDRPRDDYRRPSDDYRRPSDDYRRPSDEYRRAGEDYHRPSDDRDRRALRDEHDRYVEYRHRSPEARPSDCRDDRDRHDEYRRRGPEARPSDGRVSDWRSKDGRHDGYHDGNGRAPRAWHEDLSRRQGGNPQEHRNGYQDGSRRAELRSPASLRYEERRSRGSSGYHDRGGGGGGGYSRNLDLRPGVPRRGGSDGAGTGDGGRSPLPRLVAIQDRRRQSVSRSIPRLLMLEDKRGSHSSAAAGKPSKLLMLEDKRGSHGSAATGMPSKRASSPPPRQSPLLQRSPAREPSPDGSDVGDWRRDDCGPGNRSDAGGDLTEQAAAGSEVHSAEEDLPGYVDAKVSEGVKKSDGTKTLRAEIYVPRLGKPMPNRDRGSLCIRGPNRLRQADAEEDLERFKRKATEVGAVNAAKEVRTLSTQLQREYDREKHLATGRGATI